MFIDSTGTHNGNDDHDHDRDHDDNGGGITRDFTQGEDGVGTAGVDPLTLKSVGESSDDSTAGSATVGVVQAPPSLTSSGGYAASVSARVSASTRDDESSSLVASAASRREDPGKAQRAARVRLALLIVEHVWGDPVFAGEARELARRTDRL